MLAAISSEGLISYKISCGKISFSHPCRRSSAYVGVAVSPSAIRSLQRSRNPITNFGLAQVTGRIVKLFDDPEVLGAMTVTYEGVVELEPMNRPAHHIHMEQPPMAGYPHTVRDFYVDAETLLPAGVDLWIRPEQLDARYRYADVDTEVTLTDDDFRLSENHPKAN